MRRRDVLAGVGTKLALSTAGCQGIFETKTTSTRAPPLVEDRPDAVYVPSHVEGMEMVGVQSSGRYRLGLTYSYPHRFWRVVGGQTNKVSLQKSDTVHLMLTAWDSESGTVIPTSSPSVTVSKDGETVVSNRKLWSMLSQNMGVHFGDNVDLSGDGTYEVRVDYGPVGTRRAGSLADAGDGEATLTWEMDFSQSTLEEVNFERLPDRKGERDAVEPMEMETLPTGQLPPDDELPGESLATVRDVEATGDAVFDVRRLSSPPKGVEGDGEYLALSARTPYNRYPLPFMSLSATLSRNGDTVFEGDLTDTIHPDLGYHYGAIVDGVQAGDSLSIAIDAFPQVARHEGYETAFLVTGEQTIGL